METSRVLYISKQLINKTVDSRLCGRDVGMKAKLLAVYAAPQHGNAHCTHMTDETPCFAEQEICSIIGKTECVLRQHAFSNNAGSDVQKGRNSGVRMS